MAYDFRLSSFKNLNNVYKPLKNIAFSKNQSSSFKNINNEYEEKDYSSVPISKGAGVSDEVFLRLEKFKGLFFGGVNDEIVVNHIYKVFEKEISNGNKDADALLKALIKLKKYHPDLKIILDTNSYYSSYDKTLAIDQNILDMNNSTTIFHELGHLFHNLIKYDEINENVNELIKFAKINKEKNNNMGELITDKMAQMQNENLNEAINEFYDDAYQRYGLNSDEYYNKLINDFNNMKENFFIKYIKENNVNTEKFIDNNLIKYFLEKYNLDSEILNIVLESDLTAEQMACQYMWDEVYLRREAKDRADGIAAITDIVDAIYQGEYSDLGQIASDGTYLTVYGHGSEYFSDTDYVYYELVANYTDLKVSGNEDAINILKNVFGENLFNELDNLYESFITFGS